jgi:small subunit ribosomal protein S1
LRAPEAEHVSKETNLYMPIDNEHDVIDPLADVVETTEAAETDQAETEQAQDLPDDPEAEFATEEPTAPSEPDVVEEARPTLAEDAVAAAEEDAPQAEVAPGSDDVAPGSEEVGPTSEDVVSVADEVVPASEDVAPAADEDGPTADKNAPVADDEGEVKVIRKPKGDRPAISAPKTIGDVPDDLTADDFAKAVEETVFEFKEGDIVAGTVVRVDPDEVLVDIGYKSEGVIPPHELSVRNNSNPDDVVKVGEAIEALVLQKEDDEGRLVLSKKRAQYERAWGRIETVMNEGGTVTGQVIEVVKGGLIVDIGLRGFLPASLVDLRRVRDLQPFVGEPIEAKVIELDRNRNNVVLSRRAYLEEAQAEQRHAFLEDLKEGDVREGVVSSVVNFGAFVDLGGMDGLVHVSELSWRHVNHPGEIVTVGDQVKVKVLEVDYGRERISLSIRQTAEDPWETFARDAAVGTVVDGKVTKTVPFGAFVSVGEGVEGLVHVSEIAMHHVESPELELSLGQEVKVKVTEIDADRRRVSLSIKQALPEWEERSSWSEKKPERARRREFEREDEAPAAPSFSADSSLEAILEELKERGIGRS